MYDVAYTSHVFAGQMAEEGSCMKPRWLGTAITTAALLSTVAAAQAGDGEWPITAKACRTMTNPVQKSVCYDTAFDAASKPSGRANVPESRRNENPQKTFGFPVGHREDVKAPTATPEIKEIFSSIARLSPVGRGVAVLTLADGSAWRTLDSPRIMPDAGQSIRIRRGILHGYFASVGNTRSFRVQRIK